MSCLLCHKPFFSSAVWLHHSWPLPGGQPHLSDINHCVLSVVNTKATRNLITKLGPYTLPCPWWAWTKNLPICLQCFDSPGYSSSFYVNWFSLKYGLWLVSLKVTFYGIWHNLSILKILIDTTNMIGEKYTFCWVVIT